MANRKTGEDPLLHESSPSPFSLSVFSITGPCQSGKATLCEMLKNRYNQRLDNNLFFYRDKSREVDVLQAEGGKLRAYEIKSAERFNSEFTKSLTYLQTLLGDDITSSAVIYSGQEELKRPLLGLLNYRHI